MDEDGEKRVRVKRSGEEVDWISNLPDCLLCQVLLNLPTKVVVRTSVLSTRWRNLWRYVPGLEFHYEDFLWCNYDTFLSVVDSFLGLNSESLYLERFKLTYDCNYDESDSQMAFIIRWINVAVKRKVKYLHLTDIGGVNDGYEEFQVEIPPIVYTCESLVSLKLIGLRLPYPKFVSLPSLKVISLCLVTCYEDLTLETLVSLCPVLESLIIDRSCCKDVKVLHARSQPLLNFSEPSYLERFKLRYICEYYDEPQMALLKWWINVAVMRKVKYLHVIADGDINDELEIPQTVYTCESLVSIKFDNLLLPNPKFVSLHSLKVMNLCSVYFCDTLALETLISLCLVLESLILERTSCDEIDILRVRSQSLLSFTHIAASVVMWSNEPVVTVDAPRLKYLKLSDGQTASFILNDPASLVEADIDTVFNLEFDRKFDPNYLPKRSMIRNFLGSISQIKDMVISSRTLEIIYLYSRCEPLPLFPNLSFLRVEFCDYSWEMLPIFLECCLNLKSLVVGSTSNTSIARLSPEIVSGPRRFLSPLEYVKIERPFKGEVMEMKLVSYLLEYSTNLKKLTLHLDDSIKKKESTVLKELLTLPRLSTSCQVVVV